jgi:hypothetical protein
MIGLALLPFTIPLVWVAALLLTGQRPSLTLATPGALALTASVLSLAVVFTVDWSPATRLKGVLMLVGLAYFAALSLFFLKKDMVEKVQRTFGPQSRWREFDPPGGNYRLKAPTKRHQVKDQPLPRWKLNCYRAHHTDLTGELKLAMLFGSGPDLAEGQIPNPDDAEAWFKEVEASILQFNGGRLVGQPAVVRLDGHPPGRQWIVRLAEQFLVVRVFRVKGHVFYLSAQADEVDPDAEDDPARWFFQSFLVTLPKD